MGRCGGRHKNVEGRLGVTGSLEDTSGGWMLGRMLGRDGRGSRKLGKYLLLERRWEVLRQKLDQDIGQGLGWE